MRLSSSLLSAAIFATLVTSLHVRDADAASPNASARALDALRANPSAAHRNAGDDFTTRDVMVDADGTEHVRMERSYRGLPVFGGDLVVHSRNGKLASVSNSLKSSARPSLDARISADEAIMVAGLLFGPGIESIPVTRKVIYARDVAPRLAWEIRLVGTYVNGASIDMTYFVDAGNGRMLLGYSNVEFARSAPKSSAKGAGKGSAKGPAKGGGGTTTPPASAVGTGRSLYAGSVLVDAATGGAGFTLTDATRGGNETWDADNVFPGTKGNRGSLFTRASNTWGDGTSGDRATVAADAHYGLAKAWDYFNDVHGRRGVRGDGAGSRVYVHVRSGWANASWDNNTIYLGDGDATMRPVVSLDLVGHELSHGVTESTARLVYSGESGGLNESTSDIFGTMVEYFANNPADAPDYMIGEKLFIAQPAGRYMYKPSLDGKSPDCYSSAVNGMNPHQASGIGNHFFYLLAEGAVAPSGSGLAASDLVCNGNTALAGVGRDAAQKIWYQALTRYMTSGTNYAAARAATLAAASDLFGAGSAQQAAVAASWSAVGVN